MPPIQLTDRGIRSLSVDQRTEFWDETLPGFGLRVSAQGHKSFVLMYRQHGKLCRATLGTFPAMSLAEARRLARLSLGKVAAGDDVKQAPELGGGLRFGQLAEDFIELYARRKKRSWKEDQRLLHHDVIPAWGDRPAASIKKRDIIALLDRIVERGAPIGANRARAVISKVFSWAVKRDLLEYNPCAGVERPSPENKRDRVLTEDEIRNLWAVLDEEEPPIGDAIRLLLLTAQRSQEVRLMDWSRVTGDQWLIPKEHSKNRREHLVPLSPQARKLLAKLGESKKGLVVGSQRVPGEPLSPTALSHAARRLCKRLGFQFTPHDLRRTASTLMASLGVDTKILSMVLNHADVSVTGIYNRYRYWKEKQAALELWGGHLEKILAAEGNASFG